MSFAKIFQTIYDSSIADDWQTRIVFQDMLILAEKNGVIDMTPSAIHRRTNLPLEMILTAIPKLEGPDSSSRTAEKEGRRIERLDPHREWGWRIVNFQKYRESATVDALRLSDEERKRLYAERKGTNERPGYVYFAQKEGNGNIKIGFSANPWSRVAELQTATDQPFKVIGTVRGTLKDEAVWHARFKSAHVLREWFRPTKELLEAISSTTIEAVVDTVATTPPVAAATSASASASASVIKGGKESEERDELRKVVGPAIESALKWLANAKQNGADYTEPEMRSAFLALSAGGWKWGMRDIADWRCALERQIQTDRERKPYAKDQRSSGRGFDRNKGTCNEGKAAQYDLGRIQAAEPVQDPGS